MMKTNATPSAMQEKKKDAAEFLVDTLQLPPPLRWKIQGMVEAATACGWPDVQLSDPHGHRPA